MKRFSFKRGIAVLVCIFGLTASAFGQDDLFGDDLFGDGAAETPATPSTPATPASEGSGMFGGSFDDASIRDLFGDMPVEEVKEEGAPVRVLPPFEGNYKILISRPNYVPFEDERGTQWIGAMSEIYAHYKVSSFPRTQVFTMDQVDNILPNYRDYRRRISRQHYIAAARGMGATHVLLLDYHPHRTKKEARYTMELFWIAENAAVVRATQDVLYSAFERGLDICLEQIADAMDPEAKKTTAFGQSVIGRDIKFLELFGRILSEEQRFSNERAVATLAAIDRERSLNRNLGQLGAQFALAMLSGRAGHNDRAIGHINNVISKSGDHGALQLYLAEYLRKAERYSEALRAAETAARNPALRTQATIEMAMIFQQQGDLSRARSEYNSVMQSGEADGRVYFRLALLSILSGDFAESENYLARAGESGFALDENEYIELGLAYGKIEGQEERAEQLIRRGMGVRQNNEIAWLAIAEVQGRAGKRQQQADTYVNLFKINMNAYSARLRQAGQIYEELGLIEKAKDAYSLFLDRRFANEEVSLSLARIYVNENNCAKLPDVLRGLDTIPEAREMLEACGIKARRIDASRTVQRQKLSPLMLSLRIGGGALAGIGIATGIVSDMMLSNTHDEYSKWNEPGADARHYEKVKKMRSDMDTYILLRNVMYGAAAVGVGAFAVTWFF